MHIYIAYSYRHLNIVPGSVFIVYHFHVAPGLFNHIIYTAIKISTVYHLRHTIFSTSIS